VGGGEGELNPRGNIVCPNCVEKVRGRTGANFYLPTVTGNLKKKNVTSGGVVKGGGVGTTFQISSVTNRGGDGWTK